MKRLKTLSYYVLHLLIFLLPFEERLVPPLLVLFALTNLLGTKWSLRRTLFKERAKYIVAFSAIYIIYALGLLHTSNMDEGLFDMEVKLSLFLVPWIVLTTDVVNRFTVYSYLSSFIAGIIIASAIDLVIAFYGFELTGDFGIFYYQFLSFYLHPTYFAMYINLAIASVLVIIFHKTENPKWWHFLILFFLSIMVYQLSSRTGIITLFLLYLYAILYLIFKGEKQRRSLYFIMGVLVLVVSISYSTTHYTQMQREVDADNQESSFGVRLSMWKSSKALVLDHFMFGVGTGDVNDELQKQFAKDGIKRAVRDNLNLHNQFLQTQVAVGIFGSLSLILMLVLPLWPSLRKGRLYYPLFFMVLGINFLAESVLKTQAGVVFYSVMNSVIFFTYEASIDQKKSDP